MRSLALLLAAVLIAFAPISANAQPVDPTYSDRQILVLLKQVTRHARGGSGHAGTYGDALSRSARERMGRRIARDAALGFVGNWPMPLIGLDCFILAVPVNVTIDQAIARVARDRDVEWAQPVNEFTTSQSSSTYNDPLLAVAPAARQWHLTQLHTLATGKGVTVAIIDSQIDVGHPDLAGQVSSSRDFVIGRPAQAESHGTGVAGIVAAKANNGVGSAGIAPDARLLGLRACWQRNAGAGSVCNSLSLAKALHYALERRADVVNFSLTGPHDQLLARLIDIGITRGTMIVASVDRRSASGGFPASRRGVVAVSDIERAPAPVGVVSAPGRDIPTTQAGGRWNLVNGSSFAAAHVSGLLALMRQRSASGTIGLVMKPDGSGVIDVRASLRAPSGPNRPARP